MISNFSLSELTSLLAKQKITVVNYQTSDKGIRHLEVAARIVNQKVRLILESNPQNAELPCVFLYPPEIGYMVAHISECGNICYNDNEGIGFDPNNQTRLVFDVINDCIKILDNGLNNKAANKFDDFFNEFEGYWNNTEKCLGVNLHCPPSELNHLCAQAIGTGKNLRILGIGNIKAPRASNSYLIPVIFRKIDHLPPPHKKVLPIEKWLNDIYESPVEKKLNIEKTGRRIILFQTSRPKGGFSLFGILLENKQKKSSRKHVLLVTPLSINRCWRDFLLERGATTNIALKTVLVGCGALGSRIADMLVLSGIQNLTLIDNDILKYENVFRHVNGRNDSGLLKVKALKRELEIKRPGVCITAIVDKGLHWLNSLQSLTDYDLIILATGNMPMERVFFQQAYQRNQKARLCSTWLEPLGLGGHVVQSISGTKGCLECLFTSIEGQALQSSRGAFLEPNQKITRNLTGCGGAFTPFTSIDVMKTVILTLDVILSEFYGYCAWIGRSSEVVSSDLTTTSLFKGLIAKGQTELKIPYNEIAQLGCQCCDS